ncbi:SIMPL domain-containing protein [Candidatus Parcubacteria bacterium]|nr:SIMPL domain-containing protein [Candidatus Parcubacteria bacterium]
MQQELFWKNTKFAKAAVALVALAALFMAVKVAAEIKSFRYIGGGVQATNTISISGEGEVFAVPDIATISMSVREEGKTVALAQKTVTTKIDAALAYLKGAGIEEKDIKTASYNATPLYTYDYRQIPSRQRIFTGYEVSQTILVKVRDTEKVGEILDGLGKAGITDISGPNFEIDDEMALQAEARKKAIDDAKAKAESLAKDLGVRLIRVVSFSEGGNYPVFYKAYDMQQTGRGGAENASSVPQVPTGENRIVSNVSITYEIR